MMLKITGFFFSLEAWSFSNLPLFQILHSEAVMIPSLSKIKNSPLLSRLSFTGSLHFHCWYIWRYVLCNTSAQRDKDCLWNLNGITMGKAKERQKERKKQTKMCNPKLCFQSAPFSLLPSDLFQNQDKDYFKWGVQNYKHQLVALVVFFGENFYLKEVSH